MTRLTTTGTQRELARRTNDGIDVTLSWHDGTGVLTVSVADEASGTTFELAVDAETALDAYHHPFAYAAFEGVAYETELLAAA